MEREKIECDGDATSWMRERERAKDGERERERCGCVMCIFFVWFSNETNKNKRE